MRRDRLRRVQAAGKVSTPAVKGPELAGALIQLDVALLCARRRRPDLKTGK